jgi:hypothetical protein
MAPAGKTTFEDRVQSRHVYSRGLAAESVSVREGTMKASAIAFLLVFAKFAKASGQAPQPTLRGSRIRTSLAAKVGTDSSLSRRNVPRPAPFGSRRQKGCLTSARASRQAA